MIVRLYRFAPKLDITAFELALIWAHTTPPQKGCVDSAGVFFVEGDFDRLDETFRRHFRRTEHTQDWRT